jgi:hypothetical protein
VQLDQDVVLNNVAEYAVILVGLLAVLAAACQHVPAAAIWVAYCALEHTWAVLVFVYLLVAMDVIT